jgi:hypothetical protein
MIGLLWNSTGDAMLSSLMVEALSVAVRVAIEVRSETTSIGNRLSQQARTLKSYLKSLITN